MVVLESARCCGCGYRHLACPSGTISVFGDAFMDQAKCTDCNECIYACPCEALGSSRPLYEKPKRLKEKYDAVVIGSGIAGLLSADVWRKVGEIYQPVALSKCVDCGACWDMCEADATDLG